MIKKTGRDWVLNTYLEIDTISLPIDSHLRYIFYNDKNEYINSDK